VKRTRYALIVSAIVWVSILFCAGVQTGIWLGEIPPLDNFVVYRPFQTTYFYDNEKNIIGCIAAEWRDVLPEETITNLEVARAVIAIEDERFFSRSVPWDLHAIFRASLKNWEAGRVVEGGSTIEQQLAKQLLPPEERKARSFQRKLKELVLGIQLVQTFSKNEILSLYLNEAYLGHNRNGVEAAALFYFDKHAKDLSLAEAATLAGMIHSPEAVSPRKHLREARERRNTVLWKMHSLGMIDADAYQSARAEAITVSEAFIHKCNKEPYVTRHARTELKRKFGLSFDQAHESIIWYGIRVYTTIDPFMQEIADHSVHTALDQYHARQKTKAIDANASMIVLDNATGSIRALIGSRNHRETEFNHATQAHRQVGSAFKPIVYASYFTRLIEDENVDPQEILDRSLSNARFSCRGRTKTERWSPRNFDDHKNNAGSYTIRNAIAKSINRPALHAAQDKPCTLHISVILTARRMGIESALGEVENGLPRFRLPLALGAADLTLLELTRAYMVFPNSGVFIKDHIIDRLVTSNNMPLYRFVVPDYHKALRSDVAHLLEEALQDVTTRGTASSMKTVPQRTAGKTGTTNGYRDAWFVGFTPSLTVGTWVGGKDKTVSLGDRETGGKTALPAFKYFISEWYTNHQLETFPPSHMCYNIQTLIPPP
jgi:penicillin-binding protein 1A